MPLNSPSKKRFNWATFRAQFVINGVFITALGMGRLALGQINGFMGLLAWWAVYMPLVAALALVLAYRRGD